jgi:hypothetical protein
VRRSPPLWTTHVQSLFDELQAALASAPSTAAIHAILAARRTTFTREAYPRITKRASLASSFTLLCIVTAARELAESCHSSGSHDGSSSA